MRSEVLGIVPLEPARDYPLNHLKVEIPKRYSWIKVEDLTPILEISEAYDPSRRQYHSTRLLAILEQHIGYLKLERILGITATDLYVPDFNFVFGEARCPGRVAVISTFRLKSALGSDLEIFKERVVKEAVHEIGHLMGLPHCDKMNCVMHFSENLADTDRKGAYLCASCSLRLGD